MQRSAAVRGTFYPRSCNEVGKIIASFNDELSKRLKDKSILKQNPRAIIAPHAGYVYSGFTANLAHRLLKNSSAKRVIVIGPSHYVHIKGVSSIDADSYETPCGELPIDRDYLALMKKSFSIGYAPDAHRQEHSTETQMPFIKHYFQKAKVIELIYGEVSYLELAKLCYELLKDQDNVIVISTDLSHFHTEQEAEKLDNICLNAIAKKDNTLINQGCEACGLTGVKAILEVAKKVNYEVKLLDYSTSADYSGDKSRVVGYVSAAIF
ncbi:MAG: AmmeMemoRadiSam system protein B [Campylobacterota bacterium]|nr:AmmeMemoRadiSam system protein B [Campylobacterota bacterium]